MKRAAVQLVAIGIGLVTAAATPAAAITLQVNFRGDAHDAVLDGVCETAPGNGVCSLRAAVEEANAIADVLSVTVAVPAYTIDLQLGYLWLDTVANVTIQGAGAGATRIRKFAGADRQWFLFHSAGHLFLRDLSLSGFDSDGPFAYGGAIFSFAPLTIERCALSGNSSDESGGAIYWSGAEGPGLEILDSTFSGNTASVSGGAIVTLGPLLVRRSTIEGGSAFRGGAIYADQSAAVLVDGSLLAGNEAAHGGALFVEVGATVTLVNSTLSGNRARTDGGAAYVRDFGSHSTRLRLHNTTVAFNACDSDHDGAGEGGGIYNGPSGAAYGVVVANSMLSDNNGTITIQPWGNVWVWPQDCAGPLSTNGYAIVRGNDEGLCTVAGVYTTGNPYLAALAMNGGPTRTHALPESGSAARDAGDPDGCMDPDFVPLTTDQRGRARPFGDYCDLGAFEWHPFAFADDFELGNTSRWAARYPP